MSATDMLFMLIPLAAFAGLMLSIKFVKIRNIYITAIITIATTILGIIPLSVIGPIVINPSTLAATVRNLLVAFYIGAMIYGGLGIRKNNWERVIVAGMFVLLVALTSAVI